MVMSLQRQWLEYQSERASFDVLLAKPRLEIDLVAQVGPGRIVRGEQDGAIAKVVQRPFGRVRTVVVGLRWGIHVCLDHLRRIVSDVVSERTSWRRWQTKRWSG